MQFEAGVNFPEFDLLSSDPFNKGIEVSVKAVTKILDDKIAEYGMISDAASSCLYSFKEQYFNLFKKYLNDEIALSKKEEAEINF